VTDDYQVLIIFDFYHDPQTAENMRHAMDELQNIKDLSGQLERIAWIFSPNCWTFVV
jgi:hypothetical protein